MSGITTSIFFLLHLTLCLATLSTWAPINIPPAVIYREPIIFAAAEPACDLTISAGDTRTGDFMEDVVVTLNENITSETPQLSTFFPSQLPPDTELTLEVFVYGFNETLIASESVTFSNVITGAQAYFLDIIATPLSVSLSTAAPDVFCQIVGPGVNLAVRSLPKTSNSSTYYCYLYQLETLTPMPPIGTQFSISVIDNSQYIPGPQVSLNTTSSVMAAKVTTSGCDLTTSVAVTGQFWMGRQYSCVFLLGNGTLVVTNSAPPISGTEVQCNTSTESLVYLFSENQSWGPSIFTLCNVTEETSSGAQDAVQNGGEMCIQSQFFPPIYCMPKKKSSSKAWIIGTSISGVAVILIIIIAAIYLSKHWEFKSPERAPLLQSGPTN